jgi:hypothetical protein
VHSSVNSGDFILRNEAYYKLVIIFSEYQRILAGKPEATSPINTRGGEI